MSKLIKASYERDSSWLEFFLSVVFSASVFTLSFVIFKLSGAGTYAAPMVFFIAGVLSESVTIRVKR